MLYQASAVVIFYILWLVLSGHYTPTLMIIGAAASVGVVALAARMRVVDDEGLPVHMLARALWYWPWLVWQIINSGLGVARIIVAPSLPISPTRINVKATQKSTVGIVTYANSITLTPGTVSIAVDRDTITVHALTGDGADDLAGGGMDAMVTRFEGSRPR